MFFLRYSLCLSTETEPTWFTSSHQNRLEMRQSKQTGGLKEPQRRWCSCGLFFPAFPFSPERVPLSSDCLSFHCCLYSCNLLGTKARLNESRTAAIQTLTQFANGNSASWQPRFSPTLLQLGLPFSGFSVACERNRTALLFVLVKNSLPIINLPCCKIYLIYN